MHSHYNSIYLSPHLDDAAMSCGGQIAQQIRGGNRVLIVTVMAGDPPMTMLSTYAQSLHSRWALVANATEARRAEDIAASNILGADTLHWHLPDCIYRLQAKTGEPFYRSDEDIFGDVHEEECKLIDEIADKIAQLPTCEQIFAPLTVGHHVDHLLTQAAAEAYFGAGITYYEDYPYAQEPDKLEAALAGHNRPLRAEIIPLTEGVLQRKISAISAYQSQLSTFFQDKDDLEKQVSRYTADVGGERIWR